MGRILPHRWEQLGTHPIVADPQTGDKITGEMYDQITDRSDYFDDFVEVIGKDIAHESRRRCEQMIRRFGTETVRNSRLPDTSDIQGKITGSHVQFTKTYRGAMEIAWTVVRRRSPQSGETDTRFNTPVTSIGIGCVSQEGGSSGTGGCRSVPATTRSGQL